MKWFANRIDPRWRISLGVLLLGVAMTLIYSFGWRFGLPVELRNYAGVVLFACIILGAGAGYAGARLTGAEPLQATKIGLLLPVLWHLKEMWAAGEIYGVGAGIYAGFQGFYLAYYCLIFMVMGVAHLGCELYSKISGQSDRRLWGCSGYFFLPLLVFCSMEGLGLLLFSFDIFLFQGFLAGYRVLFM